MSVLIDTSVRVGHFRDCNEALVDLIALDLALTHPMVLVELACGTPPAPRAQTLGDIGLLQPANSGELGRGDDVIEREKLYGPGGVGWWTWHYWLRR
jgi:hypothetical protein